MTSPSEFPDNFPVAGRPPQHAEGAVVPSGAESDIPTHDRGGRIDWQEWEAAREERRAHMGDPDYDEAYLNADDYRAEPAGGYADPHYGTPLYPRIEDETTDHLSGTTGTGDPYDRYDNLQNPGTEYRGRRIGDEDPAETHVIPAVRTEAVDPAVDADEAAARRRRRIILGGAGAFLALTVLCGGAVIVNDISKTKAAVSAREHPQNEQVTPPEATEEPTEDPTLDPTTEATPSEAATTSPESDPTPTDETGTGDTSDGTDNSDTGTARGAAYAGVAYKQKLTDDTCGVYGTMNQGDVLFPDSNHQNDPYVVVDGRHNDCDVTTATAYTGPRTGHKASLPEGSLTNGSKIKNGAVLKVAGLACGPLVTIKNKDGSTSKTAEWLKLQVTDDETAWIPESSAHFPGYSIFTSHGLKLKNLPTHPQTNGAC